MAFRISTTIIKKPAGVVPLVTKGFGPHEFRIVSQGYGPISTLILRITRVFRGGRSVLRDIYGQKLEEFKIAARIASINGKELLGPIINKSKYIFDESKKITVKITGGSVTKKESDAVKVFAEVLKVRRNSDGNN